VQSVVVSQHVHLGAAIDVEAGAMSVRSTTSVPFPPGTRMAPSLQSFGEWVNGLSSDRLAIFLSPHANGASGMFTRKSVTDPFTNPLAPNAPPLAPFRARPILGCTVLIGTGFEIPGQGGCSNETAERWSISPRDF
jgi:hypothetical protein